MLDVNVVITPPHLHSHSTGHGSLLPQERCSCSQSVAGHTPERQQGGGSAPVLRDQLVEGGQVVLLLVPHVLDGVPHAAPLQHRVLASVDTVCSKLASMVNPAYITPVPMSSNHALVT